MSAYLVQQSLVAGTAAQQLREGSEQTPAFRSTRHRLGGNHTSAPGAYVKLRHFARSTKPALSDSMPPRTGIPIFLRFWPTGVPTGEPLPSSIDIEEDRVSSAFGVLPRQLGRCRQDAELLGWLNRRLAKVLCNAFKALKKTQSNNGGAAPLSASKYCHGGWQRSTPRPGQHSFAALQPHTCQSRWRCPPHRMCGATALSSLKTALRSSRRCRSISKQHIRAPPSQQTQAGFAVRTLIAQRCILDKQASLCSNGFAFALRKNSPCSLWWAPTLHSL